MEALTIYTDRLTLTARGVHATMHVYGYMHVCVSWALGWIRKDKMKKKGLLSLKGDLPQNWPQNKQSGVSIYSIAIIV